MVIPDHFVASAKMDGVVRADSAWNAMRKPKLQIKIMHPFNFERFEFSEFQHVQSISFKPGVSVLTLGSKGRSSGKLSKNRPV